MKKIILALFIMVIFISNVYARSVKSDITTIIKDSDVDVESIAVSIKNVDNGNLVFSINDKMLMNPASVQKILTTPVSVETLGWDYLFETKLYQRNDDCYILKLGADPYLKSKELNNLMKSINKETQRIFIDDSILDNRTWGEGWQWDDDLNVATPKFGSYNLDKNLIKLLILPGEDGQFATITNPSKYPLVFYNYITKGECTKIKVHRDNNISANTLILSGTVSRPTTIYVPVNNLQRYFVVQLSKILEENKIYLSGKRC